MNPNLSMIDYIDVPEVDLITSSLSHLPSSVINQPRNIDINLKRNLTCCQDELPHKRVKFRDKDAGTFTVDRLNFSNFVPEEVNLSREPSQDAPT